MSYSRTPYLQSQGSNRKSYRSHNDSDVLQSHDYSYTKKHASPGKRYRNYDDNEDEGRDELKDSIQRRLGSLKKQLGIDEDVTEDEKYIQKMNRISKRIDESMERKDISSILKPPKELDSTFGTRKEETYISDMASRKIVRDDSISRIEKSDTISRHEHERILESELRKLENRFFGLFEIERKELNERLLREQALIEKDVMRKNEDKLFELDIKTKQMDSLLRENDDLRRQIRECERREELIKEENEKLRDLSSTQRRMQNETFEEISKEREHDLLDKIAELESHKRKLVTDVQEYKNDLQMLKEDIQKDEEIYAKCFEKLKKYKSKNLTLKERIAELETQTQNTTVRGRALDETSLSHSNKKKAKKSETPKKRLDKSGSRSRLRSSDGLKNGHGSTTDLHRKSQSRDMKDEIQLLLVEIKELKQTNIALNDRNLDLEREMKSVRARGEGEKSSEYSNMLSGRKDEEIFFWKDKCETLVRKYLKVLRNLKEDNEKLKDNVKKDTLEIREEAIATIKKAKKQYKKKLGEMEERVDLYRDKYNEYLSHKKEREPEKPEKTRSKSLKKTLKK